MTPEGEGTLDRRTQQALDLAYNRVLPALGGVEIQLGLHACLIVAFGLSANRPVTTEEAAQFVRDITGWLQAYKAQHNPEQPN